MTSTVIITGASQGIGKATALLFAQKGYDVVLAARQPERLETAAAQVRQLGRKALAIPTDVRNAQQVNNLIVQALDFADNNIDVLVNNAGICLTGPMENTTLDDWQQLMDTNFWAYVYAIQAIIPHFSQQGHGTIVNVGSFGGKMPLPNMTAYCASKYAVTGLTDTLRLELQPKGIHVCAVQPSVTNSNFMERAQFRGRDENTAQESRQKMSNLLNTSVASQPEDVAKAIWDVVKYRKNEVVVGSGAMFSTLYQFFPGLMQWAMQKSS
ncbi:SDR family oxidoreductase [Cronbergia sp. UHCC 0137]|uniref:SDR family NAD(P)-dependent oxidoreductase n=1 Tax=Cronbergia sp. UHCC 0137 TaxID=3110239 RepID=UPI002B1F2E98|nr:SDR family oxidoreductase [Cronbergia sp. UHCC 0137]MEA5618728.1 SDR family oxidoreductase [Cronbergia sp. UHCC 0137]